MMPGKEESWSPSAVSSQPPDRQCCQRVISTIVGVDNFNLLIGHQPTQLLDGQEVQGIAKAKGMDTKLGKSG